MTAPFSHSLRVRYSECDAQGVAFNANYLTWIDIAITELWREAVPGGYGGMLERGADMVVAEARIRYLSPARFDDVLTIAPAISRLGTTGMTTELTISRGETVCAEATLRHVFVDAEAGGKTPIPEDVRSALGPHASAAEPA